MAQIDSRGAKDPQSDGKAATRVLTSANPSVFARGGDIGGPPRKIAASDGPIPDHKQAAMQSPFVSKKAEREFAAERRRTERQLIFDRNFQKKLNPTAMACSLEIVLLLALLFSSSSPFAIDTSEEDSREPDSTSDFDSHMSSESSEHGGGGVYSQNGANNGPPSNNRDAQQAGAEWAFGGEGIDRIGIEEPQRPGHFGGAEATAGGAMGYGNAGPIVDDFGYGGDGGQTPGSHDGIGGAGAGIDAGHGADGGESLGLFDGLGDAGGGGAGIDSAFHGEGAQGHPHDGSGPHGLEAERAGMMMIVDGQTLTLAEGEDAAGVADAVSPPSPRLDSAPQTPAAAAVNGSGKPHPYGADRDEPSVQPSTAAATLAEEAIEENVGEDTTNHTYLAVSYLPSLGGHPSKG
ncbi:unnamed protein product [Lampetra fluviatilis]